MIFKDLYNNVKKKNKKISVVLPYGKEVLTALENARKENICNSILVGDKKKINDSLKLVDAKQKDYEIIDIPESRKAANKAVKIVSSGKADALMKGKIETATFMKAALDKEVGLRTGSMLTHIAAFELKKYHKMLFVTDGGIVIYPTIKEKIKIINNSINYLKRIGLNRPKIAVMAHREAVDPKVEATLNAAKLSKMNDRGQIKDAIIDGPFAFDNAISKKAAEVKGIDSTVAGDADVLLVPDVVAGNLMAKSLMYMAESRSGGIVAGAKAPIILLSRADTAEMKLNSIVLGLQ